MKTILTVLIICRVAMAQAQSNFYTFSVYQQPYHPLTMGTVATLSPGSGDVFRVPLHGQTFSFFGNPWLLNDTSRYIGISTNGFLDIEDPLNIIAINALGGRYDSIDASSQISYSTEIAAGSTILKLQWNHLHFRNGPADNYVNFQIWLNRDHGDIELHYGPSSGNFDGYTTSTGPRAGLIFAKKDFSTVFEKVWVTGDSSAFDVDSSRTVSLPSLYGIPVSGTVFRFENVVQPAGIGKENSARFKLHFLPAGEAIVINGAFDGVQPISIYNTEGRLVKSFELLQGDQVIDVSDLRQGLYLFRMGDSNCSEEKWFVKG